MTLSAMTPPSVGAVYLNQTLALVAGAPQLAFRAASCASVVALVVSWLIVVGRDVRAVAAAAVSLVAVAADCSPSCEATPPLGRAEHDGAATPNAPEASAHSGERGTPASVETRRCRETPRRPRWGSTSTRLMS